MQFPSLTVISLSPGHVFKRGVDVWEVEILIWEGIGNPPKVTRIRITGREPTKIFVKLQLQGNGFIMRRIGNIYAFDEIMTVVQGIVTAKCNTFQFRRDLIQDETRRMLDAMWNAYVTR
jgi:hypothetical protein